MVFIFPPSFVLRHGAIFRRHGVPSIGKAGDDPAFPASFIGPPRQFKLFALFPLEFLGFLERHFNLFDRRHFDLLLGQQLGNRQQLDLRVFLPPGP